MKSGNSYFSESFSYFINKISENPYIVYTTNYDYMIGSVFSKLYNTRRIQNFKENRKVCNIHGYYNLKDEYEEIVCCAPELKENQMKKGYLEKFKKDTEKI